MKMPIVLAASMPEKTEVPMSRRLICAAPWAKTSGTNPRMKANEVIITERKRMRAPFVAASRVEAEAGDQHSGIGTEHAHDHGEQDRDRDDPAFVEADEEQEREKHGHG